jgi:hypothetical protein
MVYGTNIQNSKQLPRYFGGFVMKSIQHVTIGLLLSLTSQLSLCLEHISILKDQVTTIKQHTLRLKDEFEQPNGFFYRLQLLMADFKRLTLGHAASSSLKQSLAMANTLSIPRKLTLIDTQPPTRLLSDLLLAIAQSLDEITSMQKASIHNNTLSAESRYKLCSSLKANMVTLSHTIAQTQPSTQAIVTSVSHKRIALIISRLDQGSMNKLNKLSNAVVKLHDLISLELDSINNINTTLSTRAITTDTSVLLSHFIPIMSNALLFVRRSILAGTNACKFLQKPSIDNKALAATITALVQDTRKLETLLI